jgi:hypothetical protein
MIMINSKKEIPSVEAEKEQVNLTDPKRKKRKKTQLFLSKVYKKYKDLATNYSTVLDKVGSDKSPLERTQRHLS